MIVYHGSHLKGLKELTYTEEMSRFGGDQNLKHGAGIYLTTSIKEAKAYATSGVYYKVRVKGEVFDATDRSALIAFISQLEKELGSDGLLLKNKEINETIEITIKGQSSGVAFAHQLLNVIQNVEVLYSPFVFKHFNGDLDAME